MLGYHGALPSFLGRARETLKNNADALEARPIGTLLGKLYPSDETSESSVSSILNIGHQIQQIFCPVGELCSYESLSRSKQ